MIQYRSNMLSYKSSSKTLTAWIAPLDAVHIYFFYLNKRRPAKFIEHKRKNTNQYKYYTHQFQDDIIGFVLCTLHYPAYNAYNYNK